MQRVFLSLLTALLLGGAAAAESLIIWAAFTDQSLSWLQEQAASFSSGFGVPVEVVPVEPSELRQRVLLSAEEGSAADLFVGIAHEELGGLADAGVLADLSAFATPAYLADLSDQARLAFTFAGRLFGLPLFVEGPALIANTDLVPEAPVDYDAFIARARQLTGPDTAGFLFDFTNFYFSYAWLHARGGYVFGRDASGSLDPLDVGVASAGAVAGARALQDLRFTYDLIPAHADYAAANDLFSAGLLGFIYTGPWAVPEYHAAGIPLRITAIPPLVDGPPGAGFMAVHGVLVNAFSGNPAGAANLAKWLVRSDAQVSLARQAGRMPAAVSAVQRVSDDPIIAGFGAALLTAEPLPNIPEMGSVWQPLARALAVLDEEADADVPAVLERAAEEIRGE